MSGYSYSSPCPNCGKDMDSYTDTRPMDATTHSCLYCGFYSHVKTGFTDLDELNERRLDSEMEPLNVLPKQEFEY